MSCTNESTAKLIGEFGCKYPIMPVYTVMKICSALCRVFIDDKIN